jgi:hypothetical protein
MNYRKKNVLVYCIILMLLSIAVNCKKKEEIHPVPPLSTEEKIEFEGIRKAFIDKLVEPRKNCNLEHFVH